MLTAGDEFGRTQHGNNNAYAQDNALTWLDWNGRDIELERYVAALTKMRNATGALTGVGLLNGKALPGLHVPDIVWLDETGLLLGERDWNDPERRRLAMVLGGGNDAGHFAVLINGTRTDCFFVLPVRTGFAWAQTGEAENGGGHDGSFKLAPRTVLFAVERRTGQESRS
jgi:glycogen operon protein